MDIREQQHLANAAPTGPLTVRVREACRLTGIGRSKLYELIAGGDIDIIKVGSITPIPMSSLQRFVDLRRTSQRAPVGSPGQELA